MTFKVTSRMAYLARALLLRVRGISVGQRQGVKVDEARLLGRGLEGRWRARGRQNLKHNMERAKQKQRAHVRGDMTGTDRG